jgi:hypothetical protein
MSSNARTPISALRTNQLFHDVFNAVRQISPARIVENFPRLNNAWRGARRAACTRTAGTYLAREDDPTSAHLRMASIQREVPAEAENQKGEIQDK